MTACLLDWLALKRIWSLISVRSDYVCNNSLYRLRPSSMKPGTNNCLTSWLFVGYSLLAVDIEASACITVFNIYQTSNVWVLDQHRSFSIRQVCLLFIYFLSATCGWLCLFWVHWFGTLLKVGKLCIIIVLCIVIHN